MRWWALLLACCAACTVTEQAFESQQVKPIVTCDEAWANVPGRACDLPGACSRPLAANPLCCKQLALCVEEKLVRDSTCDPTCSPCQNDEQCRIGTVCELGSCLGCPNIGACRPCPDGWTPFIRNGCPTCQCVPKSLCTDDESCAGPAVCYKGATCNVPCPAGGGTCCANVCGSSEPRCPEPAPLGCAMKCPAELGCGSCAAGPCFCDVGRWTCKPVCMEVPPGRCTFTD